MPEDLGHLGSGAPRQRRFAPRSRVGCVTCRQRRKRCEGDAGQGECGACLRLNLECVWAARVQISDADSTSSGTPSCWALQGTETASTVRSSRRSAISTETSWRPSTRLSTRSRAKQAIVPVTPDNVQPSPSPSPSALGHIELDDADQRIIMSYYIHSFVPNISVAAIPNNFLTSVYVPMAFHCEAVRDGLLACASAHLSQAASDSTRQARLLELSSRYQMKCHKFLQDRLSTSGHLQRDVLESIGIIMMLVGLEVQNGTRTSTWIDQLNCIRNIVRQRGGRTAFCRSSWEADCLYQHFLYHDVMSLVMEGVSGQETEYDEDPDEHVMSPPSSLPAETHKPWEKFLFGDDGQPSSSEIAFNTTQDVFDSVHPLLGVSAHLFLAFQKIRQVKHNDQTTEPDHLFLDLEHTITTMQFCPDPTLEETLHLDAGRRLDLLVLAETMRLVALMILYRRSSGHTHHLPILARRLLDLADSIPSGSPVEVGLTCPLFLAGAQLSSEADIAQCATRLFNIRQRVKVMNILSAEKVLEEVWRERLNGGILWDWEYVLRKRQWVINLA
ncbi:fungal-specific transcription factor domain-containing protein [Dactylonectria macrodidyma]|uniref:Fungal-specific transcription factor domain-containing protein n=1 Tax=Dactylonectria macrodidyma TaxID=307937 RepID=A0A9P9DKC2_9HYPO|nr:fungal-specific transcription factor domain-containing protein [Dactylonectria macrodidyma]